MQVTLSVSSRGLIALPAALRKAAGFHPQDSVIAETTPAGILLRPAVTLPLEIYTTERMAALDTAESQPAQVSELVKGPKRPSWIPLTDKALKRAAVRARDAAIQTNNEILVMIDGKMVTITA